MDETSYQLTFKGEIVPGQDIKEVAGRLAQLFNRPVNELAPLFTGEVRVLKVAPDAASLEPFLAALAQAGAIARIERKQAEETPPTEVQASPPAAPPPTPSAPPASAQPQEAPSAAASIAQPTVQEFVERTRQKAALGGLFELESDRILEVNLEGEIWIKTGAMVAYTGDITFEREGLLEKGLGKLVKKSVSGEGARLTKANGIGTLYLADEGKKVTILRMTGEPLVVNGNDILALESSIDWDITMLRKVSAMMAGGLFNVRLQGMGLLAITTHHDPLTLDVRHPYPVYTDPHATVAWSGSLEPTIKTDVSLKTFMGRGSGESIQLCFEGQGFVVVQPMEERTFQRS